MKKAEISSEDTIERIKKILNSLDYGSNKSIDRLWEGFISSSLADEKVDRVEILELYKKLKLIISLSNQLL